MGRTDELADEVTVDQLLAEISDGNEQAFAAPRNLQPVGAKPPKIRYSHDALVDLIIAHPEATQNWLADQFGYTPAWVSTIITSDAFQSRLSERRKEIIDPSLIASVEHKFKAMCERSATVIMEKLNRKAEEIPDQLALQALQIASKAAGFGARDTVPPVSPVAVHVHLEGLAGNLTRLLRKERAQAEDPRLVALTSDSVVGVVPRALPAVQATVTAELASASTLPSGDSNGFKV